MVGALMILQFRPIVKHFGGESMDFNPAVLRKLMADHYETQYKLAKTIGVSQSTVANWTTNGTVPRLDKIGLLAQHYDVPMDTFFSEVVL